ncbi:CvpA family protein [Alphaproteobacteria bacterium]|jgi:membrane protein required for colicin V production|nr:CvpA family protein [Alphaproteobacteria bacterium]
MDFLNNIFNGIDILIISIILTSCVVAAFRGFVKEIFSVLSWVFSIVIAFNFFDKFRIIISEYVTQKIIIDVVAFAVPFLTSLFVCHLITRWLSPKFNTSEVLLFDKLIGFIFGAFRGVLIVVLLFLGFKYLVGESLPEWLLEAYSFHYLDNIGDILKEIFLDEDVIVTKEQKI